MYRKEFDTIIVPMAGQMLRYARCILSDTQQAEDAVQDVLARLWERRESLPYAGNLRAFVYTATRNRCLDIIKRDGRLEAVQEGALRHKAHDGQKQAELNDMKSAVEAAIARLPERQQLVICLRDVEGCNFDEIAEITGMTEPVARVMLSRARKTIREIFIKSGDYEDR